VGLEGQVKIKVSLAVGAAGYMIAPAAMAQPPAPAPLSWSGFYIGVNFGEATQTANYNLLFIDTYGNGAPNSFHGRSTDFVGGGQVGYNFQSGWLVYGGEADISKLTGGQTFNSNLFDGYFTTYNATAVSRVTGLATVRGRAGVAVPMPYGPFPSAFIYGTVGVGFANVHDTVTISNGNFTWQNNRTATSLVYGGGIEFLVTSFMTIRGEALFADLGSTNGPTAHLMSGGFSSSYTGGAFSNTVSIGRVGMNFKF
jgi:outer membrane immunogenic protein